MERQCNFVRDYLPSDAAPEPVLLNHLKVCSHCQGEVVLLDGASA